MKQIHQKTQHDAKSKTGMPAAFYYDDNENRYTIKDLSELCGKSVTFIRCRILDSGMSVQQFIDKYRN